MGQFVVIGECGRGHEGSGVSFGYICVGLRP